MDIDIKPKNDLVRAFPLDLEKEVHDALGVIPDESIRYSYTEFVELMLSGETLLIPYRIYYNEPDESKILSLTAEQQTIL